MIAPTDAVRIIPTSTGAKLGQEMHHQYSVRFSELPDLDRMGMVWRDLEGRAERVSFFNSWAWLGHWLELLPPRFERRLLEARFGDEIVGLGVLIRNTRRRSGIPVCTTWHLHEAGDEAFDGAMVEHNDFLIDRGHGDAVRKAMVDCWIASTGGAQELHLPGLCGEGFPLAVSGSLKRQDIERTSFAVNLVEVRAAKLDFTGLVSSHARRFIRRSQKEYLTVGKLSVDVAQDTGTALKYFDEMLGLHNARWNAEGLGGAFESEFNCRVHRKVISEELAKGGVQILRVSAGEIAIGYLYSFIRAKRLYVYQSGFNYGVIEKHARPGLVAHTEAIQYNALLGFDVYDLMAGESQYKNTIATIRERLTWSVWQKSALRFVVEDRLRNIVRRVRHSTFAGDLANSQITESVE